MKTLSQHRIEWSLLALILLVCVVLSFLQYRWTGELSRAEPALLRGSLNDQLRHLAKAFNNELLENCAMLLPGARAIAEAGSANALGDRYQAWSSSHDREVFLRIALATPEAGSLRLHTVDQEGRIEVAPWPTGWEDLRTAMAGRLKGFGHPPSARPDSSLVEMPIFGPSGSELGWMIFELNEEYISGKMLPRLLAAYLNPVESEYDLSVSRSVPNGQVIFSTRSDHASVAKGADATAGLFSSEVGGPGAGRRGGRGRSRNEAEVNRWTAAVRHRSGSLEAAVATARRKNLLASWLLVALLGGTAWALVQYTGRSRRLADMQFRFAAGISHDLRTPLTAIRGAVFNLMEGVVREPSAVSRYLKIIDRNAEELTAMIENVLAFSSSLHPNTGSPLERVEIDTVLRHAVAAMMPEIEQAACRIELNILDNLPPVRGDSVAIELAFRNLIGNAVRHGGSGKWIGVSAAPFGNGIEVRVCDHGPGIPEQERRRIFEPFYRGEQTRQHRVPGTGLGLSIVRNTIEQCQGTVEMVNAGGAQFTVRLPAEEQTV